MKEIKRTRRTKKEGHLAQLIRRKNTTKITPNKKKINNGTDRSSFSE